MSQAIYRRYRPKDFVSVVNQNHIKVTLQNEIKTGEIAHAYLFCGPRGIGKTTLARIFAKTLTCKNFNKDKAEPCLDCSSCDAIAKGNYLDLIEIDAASHTGVDNVRANIIETARLLPAQGKYKIFIIDEVHMLSTSAFNALLKIIEEPPPQVIFILATTEVFKVPLTIISRCQRFDFKKIPIDLIVKRLDEIAKSEKRTVDKKVLAIIAGLSDGSLRDAESLLGQVLTLDNKKISLDLARLILPISDQEMVRALAGLIVAKRASEAVDLINRIAQDGVDLLQFTDDLIELWRKTLLKKIKAVSLEAGLLDEETDQWLAKHLETLTVSDIHLFIELALSARTGIRQESIITLPLEIMIVKASLRNGEEQTDYSKKGGHDNTEQPGSFEGGQNKAAKQDKQNNGKKSRHFAEIKNNWHKVVDQAGISHATLAMILALTKPIGLTKNILKLGLAYPIHLNKLNEKKVMSALENILIEIYGYDLKVEPVLVKAEDRDIKRDPDVANLAAAFGGKIS